MSTDKKNPEENQECAICYCENDDVVHKCTQCKRTWLCASCIAQMQENGQAEKCPVCNKMAPWCENLPVANQYKSKMTRVCHNEKVEMITWRILIGTMTLCLCCLMGYLFALANDDEMRKTSSYPLALVLLIYTMTGFMMLAILGLALLVCSGCVVACLSLGIPQENI